MLKIKLNALNPKTIWNKECAVQLTCSSILAHHTILHASELCMVIQRLEQLHFVSAALEQSIFSTQRNYDDCTSRFSAVSEPEGVSWK